MKCDIVATGTELLLGDGNDTNSPWLAESLASLGIDVHRRSVVGDNRRRLADLLRYSLADVDAVIITGGLGPTHDDITRDAISDVMGVDMHLDDDVLERIKQVFTDRKREMPVSNERQAWRPTGSTVIEQTRGTAPGLVCPVGDKVIYALPGPPIEMREMAERAVFPDLVARAGGPAVIASRTLKVWGLSESALGELLAERITALDAADAKVTIALLAKGIEGLCVRLSAKAESLSTARASIAEEEAAIRSLVGDSVFGADSDTMESVVGALLSEHGWSLGTAESMTGGLIASRITDTPGSSSWFKGAVVSYDSEVKFGLLDVERGPVVNERAAAQMAEGARRALGVDVAISITGVAGPQRQENVAAGTVFCGISTPDGPVQVTELNLPGARKQVKNLACINALDLLRRRLLAGS